MSEQIWTDADNAHAFGGAACTHQQEIETLHAIIKKRENTIKFLIDAMDEAVSALEHLQNCRDIYRAVNVR
jgi:hypothetical protein